jgi:hypothetical protein
MMSKIIINISTNYGVLILDSLNSRGSHNFLPGDTTVKIIESGNPTLEIPLSSVINTILNSKELAHIINIDTYFEDKTHTVPEARDIIDDIRDCSTYSPTGFEEDFMMSIYEQEHRLTPKQTETLDNIFLKATRR